ncbi:putative manganese transporter [Streptomyces sp. NPDC006274]|uniref:putative manganese transporter n=1 Tax=unclassified Streptomyces TaxID=2593676 RepID=UPI00339F4BDF
MIETLVRPLADGFMQVGVFVALLVGIFAWLRRRYGSRLLDVLVNRRRIGPLVGALLGVSPGCAGALMLTPLYTRGTISYGTVVAGVTATMGDSSWVIFAAKPLMALKVHLLLFATGLVTGYLVDAFRLTPQRFGAAGRQGAVRHKRLGAKELTAAGGSNAAPPGARPGPAAAALEPPVSVPTGRGGAAEASAGSVPTGRGGATEAAEAPAGLGPLSFLLWILAGLAFLVAAPIAFQLVAESTLTGLAGGVNLYLVLGAAGTLTAGLILVTGRGQPQHDDGISPQRPSIALAGGAREMSVIVVPVSAIYVAWSLVQTLTGFDGSQLPLHGWLGVLVGACIGLIPGCAVQIAFTALYITGGAPLPTLVANAVSQDGDALLPLIARDGRAAALTTVVTTIPALVVGFALLLAL